jgi:hypothetical protein
VLRVAAPAITAEVVNVETFRDQAGNGLIDETVEEMDLPYDADLSIAIPSRLYTVAPAARWWAGRVAPGEVNGDGLHNDFAQDGSDAVGGLHTLCIPTLTGARNPWIANNSSRHALKRAVKRLQESAAAA